MRHGSTAAPLAEGGDEVFAELAPEPRERIETLRFVQLPTDSERSPDTSYQCAMIGGRPLSSPEVAEPPAILAPLVAMLHRYTEQAFIAFDLFLGHGPLSIALDIPIAGDMTIGQVSMDIVPQLRQAIVEPGSDRGRSNVAVTLVDASGAVGASGRSAQGMTAESLAQGYDVHFVFDRRQGACALTLAYNSELITAASAARLLESYSIMFEAAVRDPEVAVDRMVLMSPVQFHALTVDLNSGTSNYPTQLFCRHFSALAQQQPDACATVFHDRPISYRELDERSNRLSHHLVSQGVGPGVPVAVCVKPCPEILVAILAIWKARGIYLPLDPAHPQMLISRMIEEARPCLALTTSNLRSLTASLPQFCFDTDAGTLALCDTTSPAVQPRADDVAYMFYTSGTTGLPKGVMATQGNLLQYVHSARERYGFSKDDRFCSLARYTFSISLFELILPLACGASVHLLEREQVLHPESLFAALEKVTVVHAGPSLLGSLFRYLRGPGSASPTLPGIRHASSGGDIVTPAVMEEMKQVFPNAELFVIYGCTEISCMGTTFSIPRDVAINRNFVGAPFPNVDLRILDASRNLVPFGVIGEIHFAGRGISRGYLGSTSLTREKFFYIDGQYYYRTGDMGRLHADGNLEILGRRDFQVKLRGIRIELGGIEQAVLGLGLAAQCAVVSRAVGSEAACLVAFVVKPTQRQIAAFRRALAAELPDYMLPQHLVELKSLPLTVNGKLDRNRLREMPMEENPPVEDRREPTSQHERAIAEVFARVLCLPHVRVDEDFFDLGGHSLLGVILLEEIRKATGVSIAPRMLFEGGTVEALAACAEIRAAGENGSILLNSRVPGPPLFVTSGAQHYRKLAQQLDGFCTVYGIFTPLGLGTGDDPDSDQSIDGLVREHLEIIRARQPKGPYQLLGFSFAGLVAYEIARRLREDGEEVSLLMLLDTQLEEFKGVKYRLAQISRLPLAPPQQVARFFYRRIRSSLGLNEGKEEGALDPEVVRACKLRRDEINRRIAATYVAGMRSYDGRMTLVVSNHRLRDEPLKSRTAGWNEHVRRLDVIGMDADHTRMITEDAHAATVARLLKDRLA